MIKAVGKNVVVEEIKEDGVSKGGILLPDSLFELKRGKVVADWGDVRFPEIKKDDTIAFVGTHAKKVIVEEKEYLVVHFDDILLSY